MLGAHAYSGLDARGNKNRRTASERAIPESIQFTCSYVYVDVLVALVALVMEEGQESSGRTYLEVVGWERAGRGH